MSTCRLCCARCLRAGDEGAYVRPTWFWSIVISTFYQRDPRLQLVGLTWKGHRFRFGHDSPESYVEQDIAVVHTDRPAIAPFELENLYLLTTRRLPNAA